MQNIHCCRNRIERRGSLSAIWPARFVQKTHDCSSRTGMRNNTSAKRRCRVVSGTIINMTAVAKRTGSTTLLSKGALELKQNLISAAVEQHSGSRTHDIVIDLHGTSTSFYIFMQYTSTQLRMKFLQRFLPRVPNGCLASSAVHWTPCCMLADHNCPPCT